MTSSNARSVLCAISCVAMIACGTSETQVVDGALVSKEGWPVRPSDGQFRCPEGTSLIDEKIAEGRRLITCKSMLNPAPRGFELAWHPNGELALIRDLDEEGRPKSVRQFGPDGEKLQQEEWIDGRRVSARAWYSTGQLRLVETYEPSSGATLVEMYAPDGSIDSQGEIVDGVRQGEWIEWVDGATERARYRDGVRVGEVSRAYADGSVETGRYVGGERDGIWRRIDRAGLPMKEVRYVAGILDGPWRSWHPNQQMKTRGTYVDGKRHGEWTNWYPSGARAEIRSYRCDELHGLFREHHPNGQIAERGVYWRGRKIGEWRSWTEEGNLANVENHPIPDDAEALEAILRGESTPTLPGSCSP